MTDLVLRMKGLCYLNGLNNSDPTEPMRTHAEDPKEQRNPHAPSPPRGSHVGINYEGYDIHGLSPNRKAESSATKEKNGQMYPFPRRDPFFPPESA